MRSAQLAPQAAPALEISVHRGDLTDARPRSGSALVDPPASGRRLPVMGLDFRLVEDRFPPAGNPLSWSPAKTALRVGLLPLCAERSPLGGRRLIFIGEGIVGSDYLGIVCRAADEPRLARRLRRALAKQRFDELSLDGILRGDPLLPALEGVVPASRAEIEHALPLPAHHAATATSTSYLDGPARRHRPAVEAPPAAGSRSAPATTSSASPIPTRIVVGLDALFELHHKRWAVEGGSDAIDGPDVEALPPPRRARARRRAAGRASTSCTPRAPPRAALYGWRHGNRFAFYQAGYDPEWRQRSVGTVLLGHIVRDCFDDQADRVRLPARHRELQAQVGQRLARDGAPARARLVAARADPRRRPHRLLAAARSRQARAARQSALDWARRARKDGAVMSHDGSARGAVRDWVSSGSPRAVEAHRPRQRLPRACAPTSRARASTCSATTASSTPSTATARSTRRCASPPTPSAGRWSSCASASSCCRCPTSCAPSPARSTCRTTPPPSPSTTAIATCSCAPHPILHELDIPATVFVPTGFAAATGRDRLLPHDRLYAAAWAAQQRGRGWPASATPRRRCSSRAPTACSPPRGPAGVVEDLIDAAPAGDARARHRRARGDLRRRRRSTTAPACSRPTRCARSPDLGWEIGAHTIGHVVLTHEPPPEQRRQLAAPKADLEALERAALPLLRLLQRLPLAGARSPSCAAPATTAPSPPAIAPTPSAAAIPSASRRKVLWEAHARGPSGRFSPRAVGGAPARHLRHARPDRARRRRRSTSPSEHRDPTSPTRSPAHGGGACVLNVFDARNGARRPSPSAASSPSSSSSTRTPATGSTDLEDVGFAKIAAGFSLAALVGSWLLYNRRLTIGGLQGALLLGALRARRLLVASWSYWPKYTLRHLRRRPQVPGRLLHRRQRRRLRGAHLATLIRVLALASCIPAFGAIWSHAHGEHLVEGDRAGWIGIFGNPNDLAYHLVVGVGHDPRRAPTPRTRACASVAWWALLAPIVYAILLTQSRGGMFAACVVGALLGAALGQARAAHPRRRCVVAATVVFISPEQPVVAPHRRRRPPTARTSRRAAASTPGAPASTSPRSCPLTGVGAGAFMIAWPEFAPGDAGAGAHAAQHLHPAALRARHPRAAALRRRAGRRRARHAPRRGKRESTLQPYARGIAVRPGRLRRLQHLGRHRLHLADLPPARARLRRAPRLLRAGVRCPRPAPTTPSSRRCRARCRPLVGR